MSNQIMTLRKDLESKLSPMRYEHSLSVSFTCMSLAMRYDCPLEQAELSGLLHDCAKRFDYETMMKRCAKHQVQVSEFERQVPEVLHAKYGAWLAEHHYHIYDQEVINAIACHSTGKPDMGILDKILYVADYIEPRRFKAGNLAQIRKIAYVDLDEALYQILKSTLEYLKHRGGLVDPMTQDAYHYYLNQRTNRKGD